MAAQAGGQSGDGMKRPADKPKAKAKANPLVAKAAAWRGSLSYKRMLVFIVFALLLVISWITVVHSMFDEGFNAVQNSARDWVAVHKRWPPLSRDHFKPEDNCTIAVLIAFDPNFKGLGEFHGGGGLKVRFLKFGVLEVRSLKIQQQAHVELNGVRITTLVPGVICNLVIAYGPDDVLSVIPFGGRPRSNTLVLGMLAGTQKDKKFVKEVCPLYQRVRLPWSSSCQAPDLQIFEDESPKIRWAEGRIVKVNETSGVAVIEVPQPVQVRQYGAKEMLRVDQLEATRLSIPRRLLLPISEDAEREMKPGKFLAGSRKRCSGLKAEGTVDIHLLVLANTKFQEKYKIQIESMLCYTKAHNYTLHVVEGSEDEWKICYYKSYFFKKHCMVSHYLKRLPANAVVGVLDADVVGVVLERGLEAWAKHPADVQLYMRDWNPEITAGNYMVRNTQFARDFLMYWANYEENRPKGFSSADNGAIHMVVHEYVRIADFDLCYGQFRKLTKNVTDLSDYWKFVSCTTSRLGSAREWRAGNGTITIWPRQSFWVSDGKPWGYKANPTLGPVLHHGIKNWTDFHKHYYKNVSTCERQPHVLIPDLQMMAAARGIVRKRRVYPFQNVFPKGEKCTEVAEKQCPENCLPEFLCLPLADQEEPLVPRNYSASIPNATKVAYLIPGKPDKKGSIASKGQKITTTATKNTTNATNATKKG